MDDLISEFITETTEALSTLDLELVKLEQNPEDAAILGNIFRIMHTIKGTCGFLGLPRLESVAHAGENVLGKIRDKELAATPQAVTLVLESLDTIKGLIEYLSQNGSEQAGDDSALIAKLNRFAETGSLDGATAPAAPATAAAPVANGATNGAANGVANGQFPHFKGDDEPEIKAALEKMAAAEKAAAPAAAAPAAAAPAAAATAPKAPAKKADGDTTEAKDGANQSIRVNLEVLDNLMQMVSELVLTRNQLLQISRTKEDKEFVSPLQHLSHITSDLQEGVMKTRMQPIGNAWAKFPRLVRDLSLELSKKIDLQMVGAETELDRQLLEVIKDPLTHMVRNSCDHGLETPADRIAAGKPEMGTVTLSAYHEGGHIVIEISDDGRGINIERVKQKAITNGIATEAQLATMSEKQIAQFVFAAGFSTAEKVTSVSGRGVGMDVVKTNIEKVGGALDLDSKWGKGSTVSIKIPLTLAIVSVLLVETSNQKFAIPQINVVELVRVSPGSESSVEVVNNALVMRLRNKLLPLAVLSEILGLPFDRKQMLEKETTIVVCRLGGHDFGMVVDHVHDTEEIVVKPVASIFKSIAVYSGNTILGDGSVIMILDPVGIAKSIGTLDIAAAAAQSAEHEKRNAAEPTIGFLLFSAGKGAPKAVPLELVSRLEEIEVKSIEISGDHPVVQYRGELMRLKTLDNEFAMPNTGKVDVIVFSYDKKVLGLVVHDILDIVHAPFSIKLSSKEGKEQGYLGSMVIESKTTDIVDVGTLLADLVGETINNLATDGRSKPVSSNILLVEDSPFFRNLTIPFLAAAGYKVTAAEDAEQAMTILGEEGYRCDLIVTDLEMPGMNGFEFTAACHAAPKLASIPVIAYTSTLSDDVTRRGQEVGMEDCIVKTDRPGLLDAMARCLNGKVGRVAA